MARRILVSLCCLAVLAATFAAPRLQAQSSSGLKLITEVTTPGSYDTKFPHVAAASGKVYVSGNINEDKAVYWAKTDNALSFPSYFHVGSASGQSDWSNTSISVAHDGQVYMAWTDAPSRSVFMRVVDAVGNKGPLRTVNQGSAFPVSAEVGVTTANQIFVLWRDPDEPLSFRYSLNAGASWSLQKRVSSMQGFAAALDLAAGPAGQMAISFTAKSGGKLQIFTGFWDGSTDSFRLERVSTAGADYADSRVTFTPNGKIYTAWRGVAVSGSTSGAFYAERQSDGSWPPSRMVDGDTVGRVNVDSDEQGNLHFAWISRVSGINQLYYAFKPASSSFRGPIASANTGGLFNVHAAASVSTNGGFAHVVLEWFSGKKAVTRYALFQSEVALFGATPLIEGGAAVVYGKEKVQVAFTSVSGVNPATTQVRWSWNALPSADNWTAYTNPIDIDVPLALRTSTSCADSTLYTQLRDTSRGLTQDPPKSDTIMIDGVVQAAVAVYNPFIEIANTLAGTQSLSDELALSKGAVGAGDPNYTRVPLVYLRVNSTGDCTGLTSFSVGKSTSALESTYKIDSTGFSGMISMPDLANLETGVRPVVVQVRDGAENTQNSTFNIIYDDVPPVLHNTVADPVGMAPSNSTSILQDLTFTNVQLTDDLYTKVNEAGSGSREFWGVWLATSLSAINPADAVDSLTWYPVPVVATAADTYVVKNWSLATGLATPPASGTTTTYYIFVRFLDGAGNATTSAPLRFAVTSDSYWIPGFMPMIRR